MWWIFISQIIIVIPEQLHSNNPNFSYHLSFLSLFWQHEAYGSSCFNNAPSSVVSDLGQTATMRVRKLFLYTMFEVLGRRKERHLPFFLPCAALNPPPECEVTAQWTQTRWCFPLMWRSNWNICWGQLSVQTLYFSIFKSFSRTAVTKMSVLKLTMGMYLSGLSFEWNNVASKYLHFSLILWSF